MGSVFLTLVACSATPAAEESVAPALRAIDNPLMVIRTPEHGSFTGEKDQVSVTGTLTKGSAPLTTLNINGQTVAIQAGGGDFDAKIPMNPGVNVIGLRVDAGDGGRAVDGRAVYAGPVWDAGEHLTDAMKLQLGPDVLDDDEPDLDDLAALAETLLSDPAMEEAFVGMVLPADYYSLTITDASLGPADVDILAAAGVLSLTLTISDVWVAFDVAGAGAFSWLSTTGTAAADAEISLDLKLSADDGIVTATPQDVDVTLTNFAVTVDWFPDSLEDDLSGWTQSGVEDAVAEQVSTMVGDLIGQYLSSFSVAADFAGMTLNIALNSLRVATDGLRLSMDAWIDGALVIDVPAGAGSLRTDGDGPSFPLDTTAPFAVAIDDDFVHQLLFNVWAAGTTAGIEFGALELQALAGEIPAPIGPVDTVEIDVKLPVTTGPATYDDQQLDVAIGELRMKVTREDGEVIDASVNLRTGAVVEMSSEGELKFVLDARPAKMDLDVGMETSPTGLDPGDVAALVRLTVPPLLNTLATFVPGIPVPAIPLDSFSEAFAGMELAVTDPTVRVEDRWLVLEGTLTPR